MEDSGPHRPLGEAGTPPETRTGARDSLFLQAILSRHGDEAAHVTRVRNLSAGGMMAEVGEPFAVGDRVQIELRGIGAVAGQVAWRMEDRTGIAFDRAIDPRQARKTVAQRTKPVAAPPPPPRTARPRRLFGD
ncbi:PilZ domain-containing protein [Sphingomonas profundi]|uniref:PilZ domain-containing protein n=1 Tax=Alterirhizorhabdus profundi TaxID=2681549 RepID=UPI0012E77403|nr:PilZ domain-containing protein [Sphingomonas profundi]